MTVSSVSLFSGNRKSGDGARQGFCLLRLLPRSASLPLPEMWHDKIPLQSPPDSHPYSGYDDTSDFQIPLHCHAISNGILCHFFPTVLPVRSEKKQGLSGLLLQSVLLYTAFSSSFPVCPVTDFYKLISLLLFVFIFRFFAFSSSISFWFSTSLP